MWIGLIIHVAAGVATRRKVTEVQLVPIVNLLIALSVLIYWAPRWFNALFRGVLWYGTDQIVPLYALMMAIVAALSLTGRYHGGWANWLFFGIDTLILVAAVLFFATFKMTRLF